MALSSAEETARSGGAHRRSAATGQAATARRKRSRAGRGRLLVPAAVLGVLGIVTMLVTAPRPIATPATRAALDWPDSSAVKTVPRLKHHPRPAKEAVTTRSASVTSPSTSLPAPVSTSDSTGPGGGTVTAGDSKAHCITLRFPGGVLSQPMINAASSATGITYNCLQTFANPMPTWADWEAPWMFRITGDGWGAWLAASPAHQVVMAMDLIPQSVADSSDPLTWEQACAAGDYHQNATTLAENLVSYGAGSIVIRLGPEANGGWEADAVGSTTAEMSAWAKCYDSEVTAMRAVPGTHFLFVWNPNACTANLPLDEWYPGNSYVDIIGIDAYDVDCSTMDTVSQEGWTAFSQDSHGNPAGNPDFPSLVNIAAFAAANGKPLSFPEWGLDTGEPDDAAYIAGMAQMFNHDESSFESYFDSNDDGIAPLGQEIPNATAAYTDAFR